MTSIGSPWYLLRIFSASLAALSGFIDAWTAAVKASVARRTSSSLSPRYRFRMAPRTLNRGSGSPNGPVRMAMETGTVAQRRVEKV